jgi:hypothetical protein
MPPAEAPHHPSVYFKEYKFVLKEQRQSFLLFLEVMTGWLSSAVSHFTCFFPAVLLHLEYARGNESNKSVITLLVILTEDYFCLSEYLQSNTRRAHFNRPNPYCLFLYHWLLLSKQNSNFSPLLRNSISGHNENMLRNVRGKS